MNDRRALRAELEARIRVIEVKRGCSIRCTKPRRPQGMSGRQWKRARKALRALARAQEALGGQVQ
jgi:hypothetical protein